LAWVIVHAEGHLTASATTVLYRTAAACQLHHKVGGSMNRVLALGVLGYCVFGAGVASAQDAIIAGRVTRAAGDPLPGATVSLSPSLQVVTGPAGSYTLTVPLSAARSQTATLTVRSIGYRHVLRDIQLAPGSQRQDFVLQADPHHLDDIVVTGTSDAMSTRKLPFSVGVVREEDLQQVPGVTALGALQGRVAGISMTSLSGVPGEAPAIRIRGHTSIYQSRAGPLLIIDGVITRGTLSDIAADDIERVEVLKGAAATSYYGSDAANGVIQIFTRRGTGLADGKLRVTARVEGGTSFITKRWPTNKAHWFQLDSAGQFVRGADGSRIPEDDLIADNSYPVYYDHQAQVLQPRGFLTQYLSLGQRKGNTSFAASFQNTRESGPMVLTDGFGRQNFRINLDQGLSPNLDLSLNAFFGRSRSDGQTFAGFNALRGLIYIEPHIDITQPNPDGTPYIAELPDNQGRSYNPLYDLNTIKSTTDRQRATGGGRLRWRPDHWLALEGNYNYDAEDSHYREVVPFGYLDPVLGPTPGRLTRTAGTVRRQNGGATATGTWRRGRLSNTTRLAAVSESQKNTDDEERAGAFIIPGVQHFSATDPTKLTTNSSELSIKSLDLFAVTTFDYRDRYIFDALVRRDGSSLFGSANRWSTYYRVSGAWRVTEDFPLRGVDDIRLRASYGTAGLRPGFDYQYEVLSSEGGVITKNTLGNRQLRPASSAELELGANLAFGGNRYSLEYSFSRKQTRDQIVQQDLPAVAGFSKQWVNAGTLLSNTHELTLGAQLVQRRDFSVSMNLAADRTRAEVTEWPLPSDGQIKVGRDISTWVFSRLVRRVADLYDDPAKARLSGAGQAWSPDSVLVNEEGYVVRRSAWRTLAERPIEYRECSNPPACTFSTRNVELGRAEPDFRLNLSTVVTWKHWAVTSLASWWQGGKVVNETRRIQTFSYRDPIVDQRGKAPEARKPVRYYEAFVSVIGDWLESGTFVKLRELSLSYTFDRPQLRSIGLGALNQVRAGLAGRNLITFSGFTGWDPEVGGNIFDANADPFIQRGENFQYPKFRTLTATLEIAF
jgi:TonB-linked SusC/RagA family outer membrane protein